MVGKGTIRILRALIGTIIISAVFGSVVYLLTLLLPTLDGQRVDIAVAFVSMLGALVGAHLLSNAARTPAGDAERAAASVSPELELGPSGGGLAGSSVSDGVGAGETDGDVLARTSGSNEADGAVRREAGGQGRAMDTRPESAASRVRRLFVVCFGLAVAGGSTIGAAEGVRYGLGIPTPGWRGVASMGAASFGVVSAVIGIILIRVLLTSRRPALRRLLALLGAALGLIAGSGVAAGGIAVYVDWSRNNPDSCMVRDWRVVSRTGQTGYPETGYYGGGGKLTLSPDGFGRFDSNGWLVYAANFERDNERSAYVGSLRSNITVDIRYRVGDGVVRFEVMSVSGREGEAGNEAVVDPDGDGSTAGFFSNEYSGLRYSCADDQLILEYPGDDRYRDRMILHTVGRQAPAADNCLIGTWKRVPPRSVIALKLANGRSAEFPASGMHEDVLELRLGGTGKARTSMDLVAEGTAVVAPPNSPLVGSPGPSKSGRLTYQVTGDSAFDFADVDGVLTYSKVNGRSEHVMAVDGRLLDRWAVTSFRLDDVYTCTASHLTLLNTFGTVEYDRQ